MVKNDINQLPKHVVEQQEGKEEIKNVEKNQAAVALGRLGGLKGGKARADSLTAERRKEIAIKAAEKRWANKEK